MRLIGRNDLFLLVGLTVALFAIFSGPLADFLDFVNQVDQERGFRLLPGLVILAVVYIVHQQRKRLEMRAAALSAETDARQATARAIEMERLVAFGQALARSLDEESIRAAAAEHFPLLAGGRSLWAMTRTAGHWQLLAAAGDTVVTERERAARRALGEADPGVDSRKGDICFPMIVAGTPIGVLGVSREPPIAEHQRIAMAAAAALLAVSVKNAQLFHEVRETGVRDSLTGCFNRKHAMEVMDGELRRSRRSQLPLSLVMFDLDHFKDVNDRFGHLCGDAVLAAVGQQMTAVLRGSDLKCRYGGEEFLILLPDTPLAGARRVAETLRREIEEHPVRWNDAAIPVTASFGITAITPGEVDANLIIARADAALYRAKGAGRNCVRASEGHGAPA
ncbi:MAG: sensor domain-containing diguanylate cyclase [Acidobacteria bacterium]|nr:sensor domain-containing diguanylate cyclase [Acidobacteriota bacterium]